MGKEEKTPIMINDVEYFYEDMKDEQKAMVNHIQDLERKLSSARFNLDQLAIGRDAFVQMLTASVNQPEDAEEVQQLQA